MKVDRARWEDISAKALDLADESILEEALPEVLKGDVEALKITTSTFLSNIKDCYQKILSFNELKKAEHKIRQFEDESKKSKLTESKVKELREYVAKFKALKIQEKEFNFFMSQLDKYQQSLNNYLGKEIQTLYLYHNPNGDVEVYRLIGDISKAVYQDIASRGAGLSARFSSSLVNDETVFEKMKKSNKEDNLTSAYLETLRRGQYSRKLLKKQGMLILWKPQSVWKKMMVAGGAGDLGEAYLSFIMSDERIQMFKGPQEFDIDIFMLQGVALVDNISGVLKGDFSINGVEYAAKTEGASMMGYRQIISLALELQKAPPEKIETIMKREYEKILKKEASEAGRRNKLIEELDETEEEILSILKKELFK